MGFFVGASFVSLHDVPEADLEYFFKGRKGGESKVKCYRCGKPGHMAKDCSSPGACFKCGQIGHRQFECPQGRTAFAEAVSGEMFCLSFVVHCLVTFLPGPNEEIYERLPQEPPWTPQGPSEEPHGYIVDSTLAFAPIAPPVPFAHIAAALAAPAAAPAFAPRIKDVDNEIVQAPYQANSQRSEVMCNLFRTMDTTQVVARAKQSILRRRGSPCSKRDEVDAAELAFMMATAHDQRHSVAILWELDLAVRTAAARVEEGHTSSSIGQHHPATQIIGH